MNNNIDWKSKLTSRKFWVAVIGFVVPLLIAFGFTDNQATEVASIIMAGGTLIAYIIGEGLVDSESVASKNDTTEDKDKSVYSETDAIGFTVDDTEDEDEQ